MRRRLLPRDQSAGAVGLHGPREQLPDVQGDRGATGTSWRRARAGPRTGHSAGTGRRPPVARPSPPPQLSTLGQPRLPVTTTKPNVNGGTSIARGIRRTSPASWRPPAVTATNEGTSRLRDASTFQ